MKDQIIQDMQLIYDLMQQNKKIIDDLVGNVSKCI